MTHDPPKVTCTNCRREARCIRVSDGTIYKPTAWTYPDSTTPLLGICSACSAALDAAEAIKHLAAEAHRLRAQAQNIAQRYQVSFDDVLSALVCGQSAEQVEAEIRAMLEQP
jgi:hypothetical protein